VRLQRTSRGAHTAGAPGARRFTGSGTGHRARTARTRPCTPVVASMYVDEIRASAGNEYCILV
jgi:hypothetical protein